MRALPWLSLCQALGILAADRLGPDAPVGCVSALVAIVALGLGLVSRRPRARLTSAFAVATAAGALAMATRLDSASRDGHDGVGEHTVEATVEAVSQRPSGFRVDLADAVSVGPGVVAAPQRLRVFGERTKEGEVGLDSLPRGTRVRARLRWRPLHRAQNPGATASERSDRRRGFAAAARLAHPTLHVVRDESRFGPSSIATWGWATLDAARERVATRLAEGGPGSGLVRALALGDRRGLRDSTRRVFRSLGVSHLLAVSGLHLGLVSSLAFGLASAALRRSASLAARRDTRRLALGFAIGVAVGYAAMAGWGVPVRRALVLLLALGAAVVGSRPGRRGEPLAVAALAILALDPAALFDPGAQLSFAAAAGIAFSADDTRNESHDGIAARLAASLRATLRASASAIAVTGPLAAWHLGSVAPFGLAVNVAAVPWTGVVLLPVSLSAAAVAWLGVDAATPLVHVAARLAELTTSSLSSVAELLPAVPAFRRPSGPWLCAACVPALWTLRATRTLTRVAGAASVAALLALAPPQSVEPPPPRVVWLDVGQGSAAVVQGREATVLIDAGRAWPSGDSGERAIIPALGALGIEALDVFAISHADLDHRGGARSLIARIPIGELWLPYGTIDDPALASVRVAARTRGIPIVERGAGSPVTRHGDLRLEALWPPRDVGVGKAARSDNDRSLVLRVGVEGRTVLFPGDIEAAAEAELLAWGIDLGADALALPHHGSRSSSSEEFLEAVGARVVVASAPCRGRFEMPSPAVVQRAVSRGASLWWTGRDGAVVLSLREGGRVLGWRERPAACGVGWCRLGCSR